MRFVAAWLLAAGMAGGCSSGSEPHGSPVLLGVYWLTPTSQSLIWSSADAGVPTPPAAAREVDFVFDRLLDGSRIEDTVTQNGMQVPRSKATPPITASWADAATAMSTPPFSDQVFYNSEPFYGGSTAYVLLQPAVPGFPSNDAITFTLDKTGLTSAYGDQMTGPSQISVTTAPLSVTFQLPADAADASTALPSNYMLPLVFSNRVAGAAAIAPFVHVTAGGAPVPVSLSADASDLTIVYVSPAGCLGGWPAGEPLVLSVEAGAPDAFGVPLPAAASVTFSAVAGSSGAADGGCPGPTDAGMD